eukprot:1648-Heterococcus_DN1.PRE.3
MARECGTCEGLFIGSNSRDLLCCVQCNEQRCVACELQLAKKWHKSTKSIISGNKTWVCTNCVDRHEHRANSANKGKQRTVAAAEAKKGKKQQQGASATAAVHGDSIAAASVSKVVVADVCPSCKQSTESSQLDGTRQCEGCHQVYHFSCAKAGRREKNWLCTPCTQKPTRLAQNQSAAMAGSRGTSTAAAAIAAAVKKDSDWAVKAAKTGKQKKKQAASVGAVFATADAVHVAANAAVAVDDNEAVASVCPECSESTKSSKLDGTRQCEG